MTDTEKRIGAILGVVVMAMIFGAATVPQTTTLLKRIMSLEERVERLETVQQRRARRYGIPHLRAAIKRGYAARTKEALRQHGESLAQMVGGRFEGTGQIVQVNRPESSKPYSVRIRETQYGAVEYRFDFLVLTMQESAGGLVPSEQVSFRGRITKVSQRPGTAKIFVYLDIATVKRVRGR